MDNQTTNKFANYGEQEINSVNLIGLSVEEFQAIQVRVAELQEEKLQALLELDNFLGIGALKELDQFLKLETERIKGLNLSQSELDSQLFELNDSIEQERIDLKFTIAKKLSLISDNLKNLKATYCGQKMPLIKTDGNKQTTKEKYSYKLYSNGAIFINGSLRSLMLLLQKELRLTEKDNYSINSLCFDEQGKEKNGVSRAAFNRIFSKYGELETV